MNKPKLDHLLRMTDYVGITEHCVIAVPDLREGYCVDDNARALRVALRYKEERLVDIYLRFLVRAAGKNGFKNDMEANLDWKNDEGWGENFGRAMGALAETTVMGLREDQRLAALVLFDSYVPLIDRVELNRTMGWLIYGLGLRQKVPEDLIKKAKNYQLVRLGQGKIDKIIEFDPKSLIEKMANKLVESYMKNSDDKWRWFEGYLTYDNGRIPWGLLSAYEVLGDKKYLETAIRAVDFLLESVFDKEKDCFSWIGYRGWYKKGGDKAVFGQQPIEVDSMVELCLKVYRLTNKEEYARWAKKAFDWFGGKNLLSVKMVDEISGGVYDGLEEEGVNLNQGAEALIGYLLAADALSRAGLLE